MPIESGEAEEEEEEEKMEPAASRHFFGSDWSTGRFGKWIKGWVLRDVLYLLDNREETRDHNRDTK